MTNLANGPALVDLGSCRAVAYGRERLERVVLLPGAWYSWQAPLLWFAREVALARGAGVLAIAEELPANQDPFSWVRLQITAALAFEPPSRQVVIGKSLASAAAGEVARRSISAIWLTPLLDQEIVLCGLEGVIAPTMLIGGTKDRTWRPEALPPNPQLEVVALDSLDHSLQRPGDVTTSLHALRAVVDSIERFLADALAQP